MDDQYSDSEYGDFSIIANTFTQGLRDLPTDDATRVRNFLIEYLGNAQHPVPFGGRIRECEQLDTWLADPQETPYLLLAAPAGRGKSALLLHWCQRVLNWPDFAIVYFPVSIRFRTNLAGVVFPALTALLASLHGENIPSDPNLSEEVWRSLLVNYIKRPLPDGRSLLLVLDGVDEAADWSAGSALFPQEPRSGLRIVLSARYLANDSGSEAWLKRLAWTRAGMARTLELYPLERAGVANVLMQMGFPLNLLGTRVDIISELYRLSEGDPLLVRLYVDDLWERGTNVGRVRPEDLRAIRPGLVGYFERWWNDQRLLWSSDAPQREAVAQVVLNMLARALGPLSKDDMLSLVANNADFNAETLEQHLAPLARFVTGDGIRQGYVFSHPRLGNYFFEERLSAAERQEVEQRFLVWGEQTLAALNAGKLAPEDASTYVIQYYGGHLEQAQVDVDTLLALVSDGWRRAWEKLDRANAGFLHDVERAWRAVEREDQLAYDDHRDTIFYLSDEIRCLLVQTSVNSLTSNISPRLMLEAVKTGIWTPAQGLACLRLMPDLAPRARELVHLVPYIQESLRADILQEALDTVLTIQDEYIRFDTLVELAPSLPEDILWQVLALIPTIADETDRAGTLAELAPALAPYPALVDRVLAWVQAMQEDECRALTLEGLAASLSQEQQPILLQLVGSMQQERYRAQVLIALIPHLNMGLREQILSETREMLDSLARLRLLATLIPYLSEQLRVEVMQEVLALAHAIDDKEYGVEVLVKLAPSLSAEQWQLAVQELALLQDERYQANALCELARYASAEHLPELLRIGSTMKSEEYRAHSLMQLLSRSTEDLLEQILACVPAIRDERYRSELLAQFTLYAPEALLPGLLELVSTVRDRGYRVWLMAELEVHFNDKLRQRPLDIASVFHSIPAREDRVQTLLAIAPRLTETALASIFSFMLPEIFGFSWSIRGEEDRALLLAKLGTRLPEDWLWRALQEVQKMGSEANQVYVLIAVAPRIRGTFLSATLDIVREMKDRKKRAQVLEVLVSSLPEESKKPRIQEMLQVLQIIKDETERVNFFVACIPYLPETLPLTSFQDILTSVQALLDQSNRIQLLIALASRIPAAGFDDVLTLILDVRDNGLLMQALTALAAHVPEHAVMRLYASVQDISDPKWRSQISKLVLPHVPRGTLTHMITQIQYIDDEARLVEALDVLATCASEDDFPVLWKGLSRISDDGGYVLALGVLAPHVPEAFFPQFWDTIQAHTNQEWRIWLLRALASHATERKDTQLWEAILTISDQAYLLQILRVLAPYIPAGYFARFWSTLQKKPVDWIHWQMLEVLAPYVTDEFFLPFLQKVQTIRNQGSRIQIFGMLIKRMSPEHFLPLFHAIRADHAIQTDYSIREIRPRNSEAQLLLSLAEHVPDQYIAHIWKALLEVEDDQMLVRIISVLCPQLTEAHIAQALEMLLDMPLGTVQLELLEVLLPYLSEATCLEILNLLLPQPVERLSNVLKQATWDKRYHLRTLATIIPYLSGQHIIASVPIVLASAKSLHIEEEQAWILRHLASNLPETLLEQLLATLLDELKLVNIFSQLQVLEALLPDLSPTGWETVCNWIMSIVHTSGNTYLAAQLLKSGYALWEEKGTSWFYPLTHQLLRLLSQRPRRTILADLACLTPIVSGIGGEDAMMKTASAILEIGDWWP